MNRRALGRSYARTADNGAKRRSPSFPRGTCAAWHGSGRMRGCAGVPRRRSKKSCAVHPKELRQPLIDVLERKRAAHCATLCGVLCGSGPGDLLWADLKRNMVCATDQTHTGMVVQRPPIGLDRDTFILDHRFAFFHEHTAFVLIWGGKRFG